MTDLDAAREAINEADRQMAALFAARMAAAAQIAAYKAERGLPVLDAAREAEVLRRNGALVPEEIRPYYLRFLEGTMQVSREYQQSLIEGTAAGTASADGAADAATDGEQAGER